MSDGHKAADRGVHDGVRPLALGLRGSSGGAGAQRRGGSVQLGLQKRRLHRGAAELLVPRVGFVRDDIRERHGVIVHHRGHWWSVRGFAAFLVVDNFVVVIIYVLLVRCVCRVDHLLLVVLSSGEWPAL